MLIGTVHYWLQTSQCGSSAGGAGGSDNFKRGAKNETNGVRPQCA